MTGEAVSDTDFQREWRRQRQREYQYERRRIVALMKSYRAGDVDGFLDNMTSDLFPWLRAFREFAKLKNVPRSFQAAFQFAWCDTKGAYLLTDSHATLCAALRAMLPPYVGRQPRRLFRGGTWGEHERREYGLSWSASASAAEDFARMHQEARKRLRGMGSDLGTTHDGVVFQTIASPVAIIAKITYPKAFTAAEKAALPTATFVERHEEREYLVDYRLLTSVNVLKRLSA